MKKILSILIFIFSFFIIGCNVQKYDIKDGIIINEICANNYNSLLLEGASPDWVELYNTNDFDVDLYGYCLSDKQNNLLKYVFPHVIIKANGYLVVYCDNAIKNELNTGFGISKNGETIYLSNPKLEILDSITTPYLDCDISYGRINNDFAYLVPSPGEDNTKYYNLLVEPVANFGSGFYDDEFDLVLTSSENYKIYYTLDYSEPDENSLLYTSPIHVYDRSDEDNIIFSRVDISAKDNTSKKTDKCFVIRAVAIDEEGNKSNVITRTYFINKNKYASKNVLSIVTDSDNLLDDEIGIYVRGNTKANYDHGLFSDKSIEYNWDQKGREWERPVNMSYIENSEWKCSQDIGLRVHGFGGRDSYIKSFNIYARNSYSTNYFTYDFFGHGGKVSKILLKYDRYSGSNEKFKDAFLQDVSSEMDLATASYKIVSLFVNGEYFQDYILYERYNEEYLENNYNISNEDAIVIKENELEYGTEEDYEEYKQMISFVKTKNFSNDKVYNEFCKMVDVNSFIDFVISIAYFNNCDYSYRKNVFMFKCKTISNEKFHDNKWRWMMYDYDFCCQDSRYTKSSTNEEARYNYEFDAFTGRFLYAVDLKDDIFLKNLMTNSNFRDKFEERFYEVCDKYYSKDILLPILENKYNLHSGTLYTFIEKRYEYIEKYFREYLESYE